MLKTHSADLPGNAVALPGEEKSELATKTVKKMHRETWEKAVAYCEAKDVSLGVLLTRAIERELEVRAGDRVYFPGDLPETPETPSQPHGQTGGQTPDPNRADRELAALLFQGLGQIADKKGCGGIAKRARAALDKQLEAITGIPAPKPRERRPPGPRLAAPKPVPAGRIAGVD